MTYIQLLYVLVLLINLIALSYLLVKTKKRNNGSHGNDEGGLEDFEIPKLDLPPGVILPQDKPVKDSVEV